MFYWTTVQERIWKPHEVHGTLMPPLYVTVAPSRILIFAPARVYPVMFTVPSISISPPEALPTMNDAFHELDGLPTVPIRIRPEA